MATHLTTARPDQRQSRGPFSPTRIKNLRWIVAGLLFLATVINYLDRQILSVVAPMLRHDLHLNNTQYGYAVNSFLIAYAIMYTVGGRIIDLLNTRRGLALSLTIWSAASACHTFVVGVWDLCVYRLLLGAAEPGSFTAAIKAVAAWFPTKERALAIGFIVGGAAVGAIIAPPVTIHLALRFGWRSAFFLTSLVGLICLPLWLWLYQDPDRHPRITPEEWAYISAEESNVAHSTSGDVPPWYRLLGIRETWSFILARIFCDPLGYFYWFWVPSYLVAAKGFSYAQLARWLWVPYLWQGIGQLAGGYFSGALIRGGMAPLRARKIAMAIPLMFTSAVLLSLKSPSTTFVLACISAATFGLGWWGANYNAALMDAIPRATVATAAGVAGSAGAVSSVLITWFTGYAADHKAYPLVFWVNCLMMVLSVGATLILLRKPVPLQRLEPQHNAQPTA
jgi:ACS family hexuronate transporter-like MFS transporter